MQGIQMSPGLLITLMNCRRRRRCCYCCPHKNRTNTHTLTHKRTHTHIGRQRDMDTHNSCQKVKIVEQRMQQDQQQRQQREEDKERQQKRVCEVRAPLLSLSRCVPTGKNCHYILPDRGITLGGGYLQSRLLA